MDEPNPNRSFLRTMRLDDQRYIVKPAGPGVSQCYLLPYSKIREGLAAKTLVRRDGPPQYYEEVIPDPEKASVVTVKEPDLDSIPDEDPQAYATRDMTAKPAHRKPRPYTRRVKARE